MGPFAYRVSGAAFTQSGVAVTEIVWPCLTIYIKNSLIPALESGWIPAALSSNLPHHASFIDFFSFLISLVLSVITSQIHGLLLRPNRKVCFWELQAKTMCVCTCQKGQNPCRECWLTPVPSRVQSVQLLQVGNQNISAWRTQKCCSVATLT